MSESGGELIVSVNGKDVGLAPLLTRMEQLGRQADATLSAAGKRIGESIGGGAGKATPAVTGLGAAAARSSQQALALAQTYARGQAAAGDYGGAIQRLTSALKAQDVVNVRQGVAIQNQIQAYARAAAAAREKADADQAAARQSEGASGGLGGLGGLALAIPGIVAGGAALASAAAEAATFGARIKEVDAAFDKLAAESETTGTALLSAMQNAAGGEIDDLTLKLGANRAAMLGVADSADELSKLIAIARTRSKELGTDASQAFNDLVTGLGRASPEILDNLAIMVSADEANKAYAASVGKSVAALTQQEKKAALVAAVLKQAGDIPPPDPNAYAALGAAFENSKQRVSAFIAEIGRIPAQVTTEVLVKVNQAADRDAGATAVAQLDTKAIQQSITAIQQAASGLNPAFELPAEKARLLTEQITRLGASGTPAIQATTAALARQFLSAGDAQEGIAMLTRALGQLEQAQHQENAAALEAQRIGEQTVGVRTAVIDAVAEEVAQKLAEANATAQGANVQAAMNDVLAMAMARHQDAAGAANVLTSTFGISAGAAQAAAQAYYAAADAAAAFAMVSGGLSTFNGAAGLANQRSGERGGSGSSGVDRAVAQAQTARNRALEIAIVAAEKDAKAGARAGAAKLSAAERDQQKLLKGQEDYQNKSLDAAREFEEAQGKIAEDGARKRLDAENKYNLDRKRSTVSFYQSLAGMENQDLARTLSARYEAAAAQAQEIARTKGADAAQAYLSAQREAIQAEGDLEGQIADLRSTKGKDKGQIAQDKNKADFLAGLLKMQQDADAEELRQVQAQGSQIAAEEEQQYREAELRYEEHLNQMGLAYQRKFGQTAPGLAPPPPSGGTAGASAPTATAGAAGTGAGAGGAPSGAATLVSDPATQAAIDAGLARVEGKLGEVGDKIDRVEQRVGSVERAVSSLKGRGMGGT